MKVGRIVGTMSFGLGMRAFWYDVALRARHVKLQSMRLWWQALTVWQAMTPDMYRSVQKLYRSQRPSSVAVTAPEYGSVVTVDGIRMRIDERMTPFQVHKLISGRHTREERSLILHRLLPDDTVMELGGGIGMLAIACARKIGGDRVHSYEANPFLESLIRDNYALNAVQPNLKLCMLGRERGYCTFHIAPHFSRSSIFKADRDSIPHEVSVEPLNEEIARIKPTVLIFDVQGAEAELLEFADLSAIRLLLVEMHPDMLSVGSVNLLRRRLRDSGFEETKRSGQSFLYVRT